MLHLNELEKGQNPKLAEERIRMAINEMERKGKGRKDQRRKRERKEGKDGKKEGKKERKEKNNESKSWFFEKINSIDEPLHSGQREDTKSERKKRIYKLTSQKSNVKRLLQNIICQQIGQPRRNE